jgi:hypothetical protein
MVEGNQGAWYRYASQDNRDFNFSDKSDIVAAIFEQEGGTYFCAYRDVDSNLGVGELDEFMVEDQDIELVFLLLDFRLHAAGYKVVPGRTLG